MTTISIPGFVHAKTDYHGNPQFAFYAVDMSHSEHFGMCVGPATLEYEIPADFNPVASEIEAIEKKKAAAMDAYQATVRELNERLSKLQSIEFVEIA